MARGSSGGTRRLAVRVKSTRRRKASSTEWLIRQLNDPFVAEARRLGYRSRAAFKLIQLDTRFHLLAPGRRVVDLGCAPGGWSQYAARIVGGSGCVGLRSDGAAWASDHGERTGDDSCGGPGLKGSG